MSHNDSTPIDDGVFAEAVRKGTRNWDIWSKLIEGAQAQAALAIREREEMAAELAELKQRKMAGRKFMTRELWLGFLWGSIVTLIAARAGAFSYFINGVWIQ